MFTTKTPKLLRNLFKNRLFHTCPQQCKEFENPILRTFRILKEDFQRVQGPSPNDLERQRALMGLFPRHADVVIIGGGAIGSSIAYWLKEKTSREGIRVVVIEKDMTYSNCTTLLSIGGLRQQFSLPENIQMSLFGSEFLRTLRKRFGKGADVRYTPQGCLALADEENAQRLIDNSYLQKELGAVNTLVTPQRLQQKFPWLNVEDIELGCLGLEREGWFDPWALFTVLRNGAADLGAQYIEAEAVDFTFRHQDLVVEGMEEDGAYQGLHELVIKMPDGEHKTMEFAYCIIAAGFESAGLSELARIGVGSGMLSVPLPIQKRNRYVYKFECPQDPLGINAPLTIDPTAVYFRRDGLGGSFIGGLSPPDPSELPPEEFFHQQVLPVLSHRIPSFSDVKLKNSWLGSYENICFDDNGIIGPHPYYHNLYLATGFSAHGVQQAPAVGRAVAELILDGNFKTIDLTRLGFDRFIVDKPMYEYGNF